MAEQHPCDIGESELDHDWEYIDDWGGDLGVIGGTFDCGYWECSDCGERDNEREAPEPYYHGDEVI